MRSTITIVCAYCGKSKDIFLSEYNRQTKRGRINWFCNDSCAAKFYNSSRKSKCIIKKCAYCGKEFTTKQDRHEARYCSMHCASIDNVTDARRKGSALGGRNAPHTPYSASLLLKCREAHKYSELKKYLSRLGIGYEFEKEINGYIYDLVIDDRKLCIEFDEYYHISFPQIAIDNWKTFFANKNGYNILRITIHNCEVIPESCLYGVL